MQDFRKLRVWQKAHQLALSVYQATAEFPSAERYGLQAQLRRSASSIAANLAEGCGRDGKPELRRFVHIANGSASELSYHLELSRDLGYIEDGDYRLLTSLASDVMKMLRGLANRLTRDE